MSYADAGWVRYDPTPPDLRLAGAQALSARDRLAALQSALEFWWFRNVIDFDRSRQAAALRGLWTAWQNWRNPRGGEAGQEPSRKQDPSSIPFPPLAWLAVPIALGAAGYALRQHQRARSGTSVPAYYVKALRIVARRGARRADGDTAREFARRAAERLAVEPAAAFAALTEVYLAERFGGRAAAGAGSAALVRLRDSLRA